MGYSIKSENGMHAVVDDATGLPKRIFHDVREARALHATLTIAKGPIEGEHAPNQPAKAAPASGEAHDGKAPALTGRETPNLERPVVDKPQAHAIVDAIQAGSYEKKK